MKPKAFNFYVDYDENIEALTDEEVGQLTRALLYYAKTGEVPDMPPIVKVAFTPIRKRMDLEFENYETISKARAEAGKKGADKRWQKDDNGIASDSKNSKSHEKEKEKYNLKEKKYKKRENDFAIFWAAYPRKVSKQQAYKAFVRLDIDDDKLQTMLKAIEEQKRSDQWQEERFIPHAATWLNQERWKDEPPKPIKGLYIQRPPAQGDFGLEYAGEKS